MLAALLMGILTVISSNSAQLHAHSAINALLSVVSPGCLFLFQMIAHMVWAVPHVVGGGGCADPRLTDYDTLLGNIRDLKDGKSTQVSALVCLQLEPFLSG